MAQSSSDRRSDQLHLKAEPAFFAGTPFEGSTKKGSFSIVSTVLGRDLRAALSKPPTERSHDEIAGALTSYVWDKTGVGGFGRPSNTYAVIAMGVATYLVAGADPDTIMRYVDDTLGK